MKKYRGWIPPSPDRQFYGVNMHPVNWRGLQGDFNWPENPSHFWLWINIQLGFIFSVLSLSFVAQIMPTEKNRLIFCCFNQSIYFFHRFAKKICKQLLLRSHLALQKHFLKDQELVSPNFSHFTDLKKIISTFFSIMRQIPETVGSAATETRHKQTIPCVVSNQNIYGHYFVNKSIMTWEGRRGEKGEGNIVERRSNGE